MWAGAGPFRAAQVTPAPACTALRDCESVSVCLSRYLWPKMLHPGYTHSALLGQASLTP